MKKLLTTLVLSTAIASSASADYFNDNFSGTTSRLDIYNSVLAQKASGNHGYWYNTYYNMTPGGGSKRWMDNLFDRAMRNGGNKYFSADGQTILENAGSGTADTKTISSYYTDLNSNYTTSIVHNALNISGLNDAHSNGWTGKGYNIGIVEIDPDWNTYQTHANSVHGIAVLTAPGATFTKYDENDTNNYSSLHVVNHSYGRDLNTSAQSYGIRDVRTIACLIGTTTCGASSYAYSSHLPVVTHANNVNNTTLKTTIVNEFKSMLNNNTALHVISAGNNNYNDCLSATDCQQLKHDSTPTFESYTPVYSSSDLLYNYYTQYRDEKYTDLVANNAGCTKAGGHVTASSCSDVKYITETGVDNSRLILVGATAGGSTLANYSVSAGTLKNHFIVADGDNPFSNDVDNAGTSYAAPRVSGAAALVMHKFGTSAANTKTILLKTATDLGTTGVDNVYGHGLLNVAGAMSPVGNLN